MGKAQTGGDGAQPAPEDHDAWQAHWLARGQPWRREPEIAPERQAALAERLGRPAVVERGSYPFSGIDPRLSRADVEWLLAAHEDGRGPLDWRDETQRERVGLDLRGADLRGLKLSRLPLAGVRAGLREAEWRNLNRRQIDAAAAHLEGADLSGAHLEGAVLEGAHLEGVHLREAQLERANLSFAWLEGAILSEATLERAVLLGAALDGAILTGARLEGAVLSNATLAGAELFGAHLEGARLNEAQLAGRHLPTEVSARLGAARLELAEALPGADLGGAFFDSATALHEAIFGDEQLGSVAVADTRWGGVNLAVVEWGAVRALGDERAAREPLDAKGKPKDDATRLAEFRTAVRASRQLAVALRDQGLNEQADLFAYRAHVLQRGVLRREALRRPPAGARLVRRELSTRLLRLGQYVFSLFLDGLAGYGYRPGRSLAAYLVSLAGFALAFYALGNSAGASLSWLGAVTVSVNSFHGRGIFAGGLAPDSPIYVLAAVEAIVGLVIEISFIATFTQRFFGR